MSYSESARTKTRRAPRILVAGLLLVVAAITATLGYRLLGSSSSTAASPIEVVHGADPGPLAPGSEPSGAVPPPVEPHGARAPGSQHRRGLAPPSDRRGSLAPDSEQRRRRPPGSEPPAALPRGVESRGALARADGAVPDGATVFDDGIPGLTNIDPPLLGALRQAAADAADDGVEFVVNSGWRSREYQERLLREAVSKYGSESEASRWVATPSTSAHVSGDAVDVGFAATAWLSQHGAEYGLCQIYRNELWHFELRPEAIDRGCPPMYTDPTQDPRMQQ